MLKRQLQPARLISLLFFFFLSFGNFFAEGFVVDEDIQELIRDGDNLGKKKKKLKFLKGKLNVSEGGVK